MREFEITKNEAGQRFDKYLLKLLKEAPSSFVHKMLRKKNIVLNGKKATGNEKLELGDQIKIFRSRKIENINRSDTLAIRLKAGLSTCLDLDGARNMFDFLTLASMADYIYRMTDIVTYDDEAAYVIEFQQRESVDLPLFKGTIYINTVDYAILYAEFEINPLLIHKMKDTFISTSSRGFNTWPLSVMYTVSYRKVNERYFLKEKK